MAIAVNGGHVNRALDFYNAPGKYFIIGGTKPWGDDGSGNESTPTPPNIDDFRLTDVVGLKKVEKCYIVKPVAEDSDIRYRDQNWKKLDPHTTTTHNTSIIEKNGTTIIVDSVTNLSPGDKVRVGDIYEGIITSVNSANSSISLDTAAPESIVTMTSIRKGAIVEGAKYVYVECTLNYDTDFPINDLEGKTLSYRQIGLCTGVPSTSTTLLHPEYYAKYPSIGDTYTSAGTLEIIDNRVASSRSSSQKEQLSIIIEF